MAATAAPTERAVTLAAQVRDRAARDPDAVALRWKARGIWHDVTWAGYWHDVEAAARMLLSLGLRPGGRVAIVAENRYPWLLADAATVAAGGVTIGLQPTLEGTPLRTALAAAPPDVVVADDRDQADRLARTVPAVTHVLYLDGRRQDEHGQDEHGRDGQGHDARDLERRARPWEAAVAAARALPAADVAQRMTAAAADPVVTVLPAAHGDDPADARDAAPLTASRLGAQVARLSAAVTPSPSARDLVLPLTSLADPATRAHVTWLGARTGAVVHLPESPATVGHDLREVQPTLLYAPAALWERLAADIEQRLAGASRLKRWAWRAWRPRPRAPQPGADRRSTALGEVLVFRALRTRIGMRHVRHAVAGGPVAPAAADLLRGVGIPLSVHDTEEHPR